MHNQNVLFWIDFIIMVIYMMCVTITTLVFNEYQIAYPSDSCTYIIKLIFSAVLLSIKMSPLTKDIEGAIVFRLLIWFSLLSIVPDAIRCIMMWL